MITEKMKTEKEEGREETEDPPPFITYHSCFTTDRRDSFSSLFFCSDDQEDTPRPFGALYAVVVADAVEVLVAVAAVEVNR